MGFISCLKKCIYGLDECIACGVQKEDDVIEYRFVKQGDGTEPDLSEVEHVVTNERMEILCAFNNDILSNKCSECGKNQFYELTEKTDGNQNKYVLVPIKKSGSKTSMPKDRNNQDALLENGIVANGNDSNVGKRGRLVTRFTEASGVEVNKVSLGWLGYIMFCVLILLAFTLWVVVQ